MRFAVDACVPHPLIDSLRALDCDVISTAGRPAMPDSDVLSGATQIDRVLITTDKDFGELVFRARQAATGVILIRFDIVGDDMTAKTARRIMALPSGGRGAFSVLDAEGERTRPLP